MNLYLVHRTDNCNYEYESFIVSCDTEEEAKHTLPDAEAEDIGLWDGTRNVTWTSIEFVEVKLIGVGYLNKKYVVHTSFMNEWMNTIVYCSLFVVFACIMLVSYSLFLYTSTVWSSYVLFLSCVLNFYIYGRLWHSCVKLI